MSAEPERHGFGTNLLIVGYLTCSAITLIGFSGLVIASIYGVIQGLGGGGWFAVRIADFLREPSSGHAGIDATIDWIWKNWIGWPLLLVGVLAAGLTIVLALPLGNEPKR